MHVTIKNTFLCISTFVLLVLVTGCDTLGSKVDPSGKVTSNSLQITGVRGIDVSDAFSVRVILSDSIENVEIRANENLHQFIEVSKDGDKLAIEVVRGVNISGNATLEATVTTHSIHKLYASGASHIRVENSILEDEIMLDLSGASHIKADVMTDKFFAGLSGASSVELSGNCGLMQLDMSGASNVSGFNCIVDEFDGDFSGASMVKLSIEKTIRLVASGASILQYRGNASIANQDLSGGSSIKKVN